MPTPVITVENLGKRYRIGLAQKRSQTFAGAFRRAAGGPFRYLGSRLRKAREEETLWALRNVSFDVQQGEVLGIIGRNGAGKSTLLKILSRITDPTEGRATIHGRVNSLLEVGTGFHKELTGRENIYMNAALHGMKHAEIGRRFDEIVEFAEIGKFLDTPVKRYSSGMYTRLAFAVAAHLEPEILIVDEVLAVGDIEFQKKCLGKMQDVAGEGRTILFVSHNMAAINSLCGRCLYMRAGGVVVDGVTTDVLRAYLEPGKPTGVGAVSFERKAGIPIFLKEARILDLNGCVTPSISYQDPFVLRLGIEIADPSPSYYAVVHLVNSKSEVLIFTADDDLMDSKLVNHSVGMFVYELQFPARLLKPGRYSFTIKLVESQQYKVFDEHVQALVFDVFDNVSRRAHRAAYRPMAAVAPEIEWVERRV